MCRNDACGPFKRTLQFALHDPPNARERRAGIVHRQPVPKPPATMHFHADRGRRREIGSRARRCIAEDEDPLATLPEEEAEQERRKKAAQASALTLEMVGDLPFANVRPPENVLFVCKLNPVTRDEDLELIFSRFGTIMSCQVIRDKKTGDSLQYAFIEFDKREDAEQVCVTLLTINNTNFE